MMLVGQMAVGQMQMQEMVAKSPVTTMTESDREDVEDFTPSQSRLTGDILFTETFSNGYDGDNGIGAMVPVDNSASDFDIWRIAPTDGSPGSFGGGIGGLTLSSATSDNGYAWLDCFGYYQDQGSPNPFPDIEASLATPSLDFSENSSVILQYTQRFAYCCFSFSPLTVEVSVDGGTEWSVFPGHGTFLPDANSNSGNLTTTIDISCVAAGESDVIIRWGYSIGETGFGFYSWAIDDILICEGDVANDLVINQITNGDVLNIWEYRVTPIQQAIQASEGGMYVDIMYTNAGTDPQTDVVFDIEVIDSNDDVVFTLSTDPIDIPSNGTSDVCPYLGDTLSVETGFVPTEIGAYTLRVTAAGAQTDETPDDNVMDRSIEYTSHTYAHDDQNMLDVEYAPELVDGLYDRFGVGCFFTVPNPDSEANGVMVRFGPNTQVGAEFSVKLHEYFGGDIAINPLEEQEHVTEGFHEVEASEIPADMDSSFDVWIQFDDEYELDPENIYFISLSTPSQTNEAVTVMGQSLSDTDFSSRVIALSGDQIDTWFSDQGTPAIRLTMDNDPTGIQELALSGAALGQNMPNPATGVTTIQWNLERAMDVDFQVVDNMGRVVYTQSMGNLPVGLHQVELDATKLAPGIYQYAIISEGHQLTKSMVVAK